MEFKKGQKVVCVNDVFDKNLPRFTEVFEQLPKKNKTYTVRLSEGGRILLDEIVNPETAINLGPVVVFDEPGFDSNRFRDLTEMMKEFEEEAVAEYVEPEYIPSKQEEEEFAMV